MTPISALAILFCIYAVSELIAQKTKAIFSTVLSIATVSYTHLVHSVQLDVCLLNPTAVFRVPKMIYAPNHIQLRNKYNLRIFESFHH